MTKQKRTIKRTTSASERSRKYSSMLKTEISTTDDIQKWAEQNNLGYDVDALVAEVNRTHWRARRSRSSLDRGIS